MIQPELNEQQLAELAQILEIAKTTEKKARELNELVIGLVLVTKYRKKVIDKTILQRLQEIFANTCEKWGSLPDWF